MALFGNIAIPGKPDLLNIEKLDALPMAQIQRMMRVGIAIDREWFWQMSSDLEAEKTELRKQITSYIPADELEDIIGKDIKAEEAEEEDEGKGKDKEVKVKRTSDFNVNSAVQMAELLFKQLGVGRGKQLKMTKTGDRLSTGKKQLETLKKDHPVIPLILEYRECAKLRSTYCEPLPKLARLHNAGECQLCGLQHPEAHWRVHTQLVTTRTDTGRLASRKPNLQNISTRTERGRRVRKGFVAQKGKLLVSRDYAQIELRLLAHLANESNMIRIFEANGDIHLDTAMRAFNINDPKKVDKILHRAPCKNVNFGVCYGLGGPGLYDLMAITYATAGQSMPDWITLQWCEDFIDKWFDLYPAVRQYVETQHYRARRYEIVWTPMGRVRRIPEVRSVHQRVQMAGLRQAGNMPNQGYAADTMKIGMARSESNVLSRLRDDNRIYAEALLPIHDELVSEVDEDWADDVGEMVGVEMERALVDEDTGVLMCRVPIKTDGHSMKQWAKD